MRPAQRRVQKYNARKRKVTPEEFIHNQLVQFEKYDQKHHEFYAEYLGSLAIEREKRLDDIKSALWAARLQSFQLPTASRIVGGNYARNPLCTFGSTIEGGRFNFGGQASYMGAFHPSLSQWFGHYARAAGVAGIVYSSVRNGTGANVAVFPDNFRDTGSLVEISDQQRIVPPTKCRMDATNYQSFFQDDLDSGLLQ